MTRFVFATATSLDGFLADADHSLEWLFAVDGGDDAMSEMAAFVEGVGVLVMGSTTYRWVVEHENLVEKPETWTSYYGDRRTFVFTSRPEEMPVIPGPVGESIEFVGGSVADHLDPILETAAGKDVWVMGGGDLAAQFADAGRLDELQLSIAPVTLGSGAPLFTGRLESDRLQLVKAHQVGQFLQATYRVTGP
ncbi:dihydrofolate reductase family protein [Nocardioides sp. Kera G14]|uniref:dihydrofolate reductase family protein n=1 Tax=Nocardioides sp. Kera G14 TaxID=2884264 RepID=UPI001D10168A|nr:dihydrofolate reductase family protein [Nocardioides sp. Kera G14]UDY22969.1 dihydrofolate reductase family protein [Nocardioides sp. Kera G14]